VAGAGAASMSRRRWVYTRGGKPILDENGNLAPVEVAIDNEPPARLQISMDRHYENMAATDGTDIGSRRKHQEYMKRNNLTLASDYKNEWAKAEQERAKAFTGQHDKRERREAIERAFYQRRKH
jgi:hypothetical protein